MKNVIDRIKHMGVCSDKIFAILIFGSQARKDKAADEYSDLDVILIVDEPDYFISTDQWLCEIGSFNTSFTETLLDYTDERRILFDNTFDIDFIFWTKKTIMSIPNDEALLLFSRGYSFLVDKIGLEIS